MKVIYLKDGDSIKVSQYEEIRYKDNWVHIHGGYQSRYELRQSIPTDNIKIIKEE